MNQRISTTRSKGRNRWRRYGNRRGATTVEFALVAPIIFLFIFSTVEFGRAFMAMHCLEGAAHDGCRIAILKGATVDSVEEQVTSRLRVSGIPEHEITVSPSTLNAAEQWDPITVSVTANYGDISWLPVPTFIANLSLSGTCTLPREAESDD